MPTPSSGAISWSQIQAQTGGAYSMSNFNAVTGRGYDASDYYSYSPPDVTCYLWYIYSSGFVDYYDCFGNYQAADYYFAGDTLCGRTAGGPVYSIGTCAY